MLKIEQLNKMGFKTGPKLEIPEQTELFRISEIESENKEMIVLSDYNENGALISQSLDIHIRIDMNEKSENEIKHFIKLFKSFV